MRALRERGAGGEREPRRSRALVFILFFGASPLCIACRAPEPPAPPDAASPTTEDANTSPPKTLDTSSAPRHLLMYPHKPQRLHPTPPPCLRQTPLSRRQILRSKHVLRSRRLGPSSLMRWRH